MRYAHFVFAAGLLAAIWAGRSVSAQQVTIATPFQTLHSSFFEQNAISFSGNYRGINFAVGGASLAQPAFGGFSPSAGLSTGFQISGPNGFVNFNGSFGQGATQSAVSQTPSVTVMNGQTGSFSDTSQTPFVVSLIPVVGGFRPQLPPLPPQVFNSPQGGDMMVPDPRVQTLLQAKVDAMTQAKADAAAADAAAAAGQAPAAGPAKQAGRPPKANVPEPPPVAAGFGDRLTQAQESSAGRAAPSVAEARRLHAQEQGDNEQEMLALLEHARALEDDGKPNIAKIYYQRVARHGAGAVKEQAQQRLDALRGTSGQ